MSRILHPSEEASVKCGIGMQPSTPRIENALVLRGDRMNRRCRKCFLKKVCHKKPSYKAWLKTYTKKAVTAILVIALIDLQLSYVLAFMGQVQIAESLSSTIATTIVGVMIGYFLKALFETFFEKREERLNKESESAENTNYEEV